MRVLLLGHDEVLVLLPMERCIALMEEAMRSLAAGEAYQPLRSIHRPRGAAGLLGLMPAWRGGSKPWYGLKLISVFPANARRGLDPHQGAVLLLDGETGELAALLDAGSVTALRTAAMSGLATRTLAREDAAELVLFGTGHQARPHLEAIAAVRPIRRTRVLSLRAERARAFADSAGGDGFSVEVASDAETAVREADIIVTITSSRTPVLAGAWLRPGVHVNLVGACLPDAREADGEAMARARVFVDSRESAEHEAGDLLLARAEGAVEPDAIYPELGEVLLGSAPGRQGDDEITVFESLGLAVQDLAVASFLYDEARARGEGTWVDL